MENELVFHEHINECCIRIFTSDVEGQFTFIIQDMEGQEMTGVAVPGKYNLAQAAEKIYANFLTQVMHQLNFQVQNNECHRH